MFRTFDLLLVTTVLFIIMLFYIGLDTHTVTVLPFWPKSVLLVFR